MLRHTGYVLLMFVVIASCSNETELTKADTQESVSENILSVQEAKEIMTEKILRSSYASDLLQRNPYLEEMDWGPVILVENTGIEVGFRYYYILHGKMPDNAIGYIQAMNAYEGKLLSGGVVRYNSSKKMFLLSPEEARDYAASKLTIPENAAVKAVFYQDRTTRSIFRHSSWKYKIYNPEGGLIQTSQGKVEAVYVNPFVTSVDAVPTATNISGRFYTTRLTALKPIPNFKRSPTALIQNDKQFVALE